VQSAKTDRRATTTLEPFQKNVFEVHAHRRAGVDLQRKPSTDESLRIAVIQFTHGSSIDSKRDVAAFGNDRVIIPVIGLHSGQQFCGIVYRASDSFVPLVLMLTFCPRSASTSRSVYSMITPVQRPSAEKSACVPTSASPLVWPGGRLRAR